MNNAWGISPAIHRFPTTTTAGKCHCYRISFQTGDDLKSPASATGRAQFTYRQLNHNLQPDSRLPSSNPARINDVLEYLSNSVKEEQRRCEHFLTVQKSKM